MTDLDDPQASRLAEIVHHVIAPLVAIDGGVIEWKGTHDGVAVVRLGGACAGCPGQWFTLRAVLLPALQSVDPSITDVKVEVAI